MTTQPDLFDVGERVAVPKVKVSRATPAPVGGGPAGERCGTCAHATRTMACGGKVFYKCGLMQKHWTHGAGTDIKLRWPACSQWQSREE